MKTIIQNISTHLHSHLPLLPRTNPHRQSQKRVQATTRAHRITRQTQFKWLNHFGQGVVLTWQTPLRVKSMAAHNRKLSEILKKGGLVVYQSVVLLMKCVQVQFFATQESGRNFFYFVAKNCVNSIASNPPFLKLRQALMR